MEYNRKYFDDENCACLISVYDEKNFYDIQLTLFSFGYFWYSGYQNKVQKLHSYKDNEYSHIFIEYHFSDKYKKIIQYPLGGNKKINTDITRYNSFPIIDGKKFVQLNRAMKLKEIFDL